MADEPKVLCLIDAGNDCYLTYSTIENIKSNFGITEDITTITENSIYYYNNDKTKSPSDSSDVLKLKADDVDVTTLYPDILKFLKENFKNEDNQPRVVTILNLIMYRLNKQYWREKYGGKKLGSRHRSISSFRHRSAKRRRTTSRYTKQQKRRGSRRANLKY